MEKSVYTLVCSKSTQMKIKLESDENKHPAQQQPPQMLSCVHIQTHILALLWHSVPVITQTSFEFETYKRATR